MRPSNVTKLGRFVMVESRAEQGSNGDHQCPENEHKSTSVTIPDGGGTHIGRLVRDHESVKQGTGPPTPTVVRIERSSRGFRRSLPRRQRNQASTEDLGQRPRSNCRRSESTLGEGKWSCRSSQETNHVSLSSAQDCGRTKGEVG